MPSEFVTRAYVLGEGGSIFQILRDFLHRVGFRETVSFRDPSLIAEAVRKDVWPVVLVDSTSTTQFDVMGLFDTIYSTVGHELLPFVIVGTPEDRRAQVYAKGVGARGFLQRPLIPGEATTLMKPLLAPENDKWIPLALDVSRKLMLKNYEQASSGLFQLTAHPVLGKGAEIALLRVEILQGQFSRAEERLVRLLKKFPGDLRMYCEAAEYFKATTQPATALKFLREIQKTKALPNRTWDRVCLSLEIDDLNGATEGLEELTKVEQMRNVSARGFLQLFLLLGLNEYVPHLLKGQSALGREYAGHMMRAQR